MKKWAVLGLALLFGAALAGAPSPAAAELKVGVSGYVKLDIQYSDKIVEGAGSNGGKGDASPAPSSVPLDTDKEKDNTQTILEVRQTRVRVTFSDEVAGVKMSGRVETDFSTGDGNAKTSNSRHLRIRHAFAQANHPSGWYLLAGQTWSTFMNVDIAAPDLVDFNGPAGQIFARQPMLRVGTKIGDLVIEGAIEKASTSNLGATSIDEAQGEGQDVPNFVGRVQWLSTMFKAEAAAIVSKPRVVLTGGKTDSDSAFGVQVSAEVNFAPVTLFGHYQHIDGVGGYTAQEFGTQVFLVGSNVETVESNGFYVGARLDLTKDTSLNGVFGWDKLDKDAVKFGASTTSLEKVRSIHVNVLHKFWGRWMAGLEYRRFDVEAFNGTDGDVNIVHGALWFFF